MGRPPSANTIVERGKSEANKAVQVQAPVATEMFLPNYSGLKEDVLKTDTSILITNDNINSYVSTNHAALSNLSYAASGHTGFQAAGTYVTDVTASGNIASSGGTTPNITFTGVLPIANGGTNNSSAYTAGSVIFSDGTKLTQDNTNFYWDDTNNRLGIGTSTPAHRLNVINSASSSVWGAEIENTHSSNKNILILKGTASIAAAHPTISYGNAGFGTQQKTNTANNSANFTFYTANGNDAGSIICRMVQHTNNQPKGDVVIATANGSVTLNPILSCMSNGDIYFGSGIAGYDQKIIFDGETNDGILYWKEDEDYFEFEDAVVGDNDLFFIGDGSGLPYGSCWGNEIAWTQANAAQNTWYNISDTDMTDGQLNLVTHDGDGKLTVTKAGRYLINYSLSIETSVANTHLESGIEITGSGSAENAGRNHVEAGRANAQYACSGTAILDLAAKILARSTSWSFIPS